MDKLLICTDLDRTLIPNGPEPESSNARQYFSALVNRLEITLAYVSGRDKKLVEKAINQYCLPNPDFVIGDVGTSIYHVGNNHAWRRQIEWEDKIGQDWRGRDHSAVRDCLSRVTALRSQEYHKQNRFKMSYYVQLSEDTQQLSEDIENRLSAAGLKSRLIWSVDEPAGTGLLDIIPGRASKLHAIEELMGLQGFDAENSVFCGDSGNDLEVLVSPIPAVLVNNSQSRVKQQAQTLVNKNGNNEQLYIAKGLFRGLNGNYSAGMLEGIAHYYPDTVRWMELGGLPEAT